MDYLITMATDGHIRWKMKTCTGCKTEKPLSDFGNSSTAKDGKKSRCRACTAAYDASPERVAARAAYASGAGKEKVNAAKARYIESNPKKRAAHMMVGAAMKRADLRKGPCEVCGSWTVVAHHDDYDKPLTVRWLCAVHHEDWHRANGPGLNGDPE